MATASASKTSPKPLRVYNSLGRKLETFEPRKPGHVSWYACGPTVYDDAHLGHARNYVSTDIIRRILQDYFKYKVNFVMNVTDVDDKIILRSRENYFFEQWRSKNPQVTPEVKQLAEEAYKAYALKRTPFLEQSADSGPLTHDDIQNPVSALIVRHVPTSATSNDVEAQAKIKMHLSTVHLAANAINGNYKDPDAFYVAVKDVVAPYLDKQYSATLDGTDHTIFNAHSRIYENRFLEDMQNLNVLPPDELVRVTECGNEIAEFVAQIEKNKYAYSTEDNSVYFDITNFEKDGYEYAQLEPQNKKNRELQADGEGALSQRTSGKRSDADFALWKASKPGEPCWSSKWGPGRPGWHIECSAMASAKLGRQMDIHSGGIDLAFPHHDNEIAQSEGYWKHEHGESWVRYFLHMGHLSISGAKMSKSLKNFTTIRKALEDGEWTSRSMRIAFLLGSWHDGIELTETHVIEVDSWEERLNVFFDYAKDQINSPPVSSEVKHTDGLAKELAKAQDEVDEALRNSFDTRAAMNAIYRLVVYYLGPDRASMSVEDVKATALFVTRMVTIFGLNGKASGIEIGWGNELSPRALQYAQSLSGVRDDLRAAAMCKDALAPRFSDIIKLHQQSANGHAYDANSWEQLAENWLGAVTKAADANDKTEILRLSDRLRDVDLWDHGVWLEDRKDAPALIRKKTRDLEAQRQKREQEASLKEKQKAENKAKKDAEAKAREEKAKISHKDMFKTDEYSEWDQDGVPTKMRDGEAVNKSKSKTLKKAWDAQRKIHEAWLAKQTTT